MNYKRLIQLGILSVFLVLSGCAGYYSANGYDYATPTPAITPPRITTTDIPILDFMPAGTLMASGSEVAMRTYSEESTEVDTIDNTDGVNLHTS